MAERLENRYSRNFDTLGPEDQACLGKAHVAVLGLGGLGGGVCELLARIGVGRLTLIDGDVFDSSNLNRQLLSREDNLGCYKAEAAANRIKNINSSVRVTVHKVFARPENIRDLIRGCDLAVDCLDTIQARFLLQDAVRDLDIPLVSGAIAGVTGQVTVIFPGDPGFELIYGPPSSDDGAKDSIKKDNKEKNYEKKGIEIETGNLAHCALFVASLQASEAVKVLLGRGEILRNQLLIADLWTNTMEVMDLI